MLDLASGMRYHRRAFPAFGLLPLCQVVSPFGPAAALLSESRLQAHPQEHQGYRGMFRARSGQVMARLHLSNACP